MTATDAAGLADTTAAAQLALPAGWRVMRDTVGANAHLIPRGTPVVAGYVDGRYAWTPADWELFPAAARPRITVEPFGPDGQPTGYPFGDWTRASIIDTEYLAFDIAQAARFVPARNGFRPGTATVYRSKDGVPALLRALRGLNYWVWVAWYWDRGVPGPADAAALALELGLAGYGVGLAAWQYAPGAAYDNGIAIDPGWHPGPGP